MACRGRSWAAREVCVASQDVSGEIPEALWRRFGSSWGALGALFGSIFGLKSSSLQFQIEKCTRSVFQLDEVYNSCCFKSHWKRIRWQKPIKKLVLLLPQRKIRCATTSLFGVGGSGRRPLESPSPAPRRPFRRYSTGFE